MPNFKFTLNNERWQEWQLGLTGVDHSMFVNDITIIVEAEDAQDAKNVLGTVINIDNFDLQSESATPYEIPGGCGSE